MQYYIFITSHSNNDISVQELVIEGYDNVVEMLRTLESKAEVIDVRICRR